MTFDEIVDDLMDRLNLSSTDARTRLGREVNRYYRRVRTSVGLATSSREKAVSGSTTIGSANVTFSAVQKVLSVYDDSAGRPRLLDEITFEELREFTPADGGPPQRWAVESQDDSTVTILIDVEIDASGPTNLKADVISTRVDLVSGDIPPIPEDFHDMLIEGVLADEYRKREKLDLAKISLDEYERRLGDLRLWIAKSNYLDLRQGELAVDSFGRKFRKYNYN